MSEQVEECKVSVMEDNPDLDESQAYAICQAEENEGNLQELSFEKDLAEDDPCWEGYVQVGMKTDENGNEVPNCVPEEDADLAQLAEGCPEGHVEINGECTPIEEVEDVPPSALDLSTPRIMQGATRLDLQPIEREELSNGEVAYRNIKLIDKGVWTDENSRTPTLYDKATFENTEPESGSYEGPPVNIHHDLNASGEPNDASVGGYIDPNSLSTDGDALFGDLILDTGEAAGDFADENLQSSLESNGEVGFSPSVELTPTEMREADHPEAEEHVAAAKLTGLGLVRDPASKSVDFAHETRNREVAMAAADSQNVKVLSKVTDNMDVETLREQYNLSAEIDEATVKELHEAGALTLKDDYEEEEEEEEEEEMAEGEEEDEEDEEEEMDMMDDEVMDMIQEEMDDVWGKIEELEEMMMGEEMEATLADATEELEETKKELSEATDTIEEQEKRLSKIEDEPVPPKTLKDGEEEDEDWYNSDSGVSYDSATGSTSF